MKKKSLVQEARFLANYEYETRKKNYQNEYKNCKDFILI